MELPVRQLVTDEKTLREHMELAKSFAGTMVTYCREHNLDYDKFMYYRSKKANRTKAWDFRKQTGFTKSLPQEIQREAANLADKGFTNLIIARALGVTKSSVAEWRKKYPSLEPASFAEVQVVDERPSMEIRVSGKVQGCLVEITGVDFSLLQRLMRKLGN